MLSEAKRLVDAGVKEILVSRRILPPMALMLNIVLASTTRAGKNQHGQPVRTVIETGDRTRLHYVYPYPHVDDVIPLMQKAKSCRIWTFRCSTPARAFQTDEASGFCRSPTGAHQTVGEICPELTLRSTFIVGFPGERKKISRCYSTS